ncbi:MAG: hypothetical protein LBN37_00905 [Bacteroidales bacterium]|nr:hypothetical protein [Bacteroidales bacterium]
MGLVALLFLEYSNITLFDDLNTSETIAVTQFYGWSEVFCFTFGAALLALSTIAKNSAIIAMYIGHTNGNIQTKTVDNGESKVNDAPKEE